MKRKLAKTFAWSGIAFVITVGVAYYVSGDWTAACSVGVGCRLLKFGAYFGLETLFDAAWPQ